jgi:hypothetical protein
MQDIAVEAGQSGKDIAAPGLSPEARQRIRAYALTPDQMAFFHVVPGETGLSHTIWASQSEAYPVLLVSPGPGRLVVPPPDVLVVSFDETTPFPDVNEWLADNRHLLAPLARQEIDVGDFYDRMRTRQPQ